MLRYSNEEVSELVRHAKASHQTESAVAHRLSEDEIEAIVRAFCHAKQTYAVHSCGSVISALEEAGMAIEKAYRMFDSASSAHRAATPRSHFIKYGLLAQKL
jgi:hypothetical protein